MRLDNIQAISKILKYSALLMSLFFNVWLKMIFTRFQVDSSNTLWSTPLFVNMVSKEQQKLFSQRNMFGPNLFAGISVTGITYLNMLENSIFPPLKIDSNDVHLPAQLEPVCARVLK